jgi:imidazole glycerol-phosphate synthase subunit HisH
MDRRAHLALVDYGSGNLCSVEKALASCGAAVTLARGPGQIEEADAVVVPGVGSFGDCAANLRASGMWDTILAWLREDRPYLGICLGYQLLFESSEESPGASGFGVLPGSVVRFPPGAGKVPHMGWNRLLDTRGILFDPDSPPPWFYFVHSYYPVPADPDLASSWCTYGPRFAASVGRGNLHATQFHPEKSQREGLGLLRRFLGCLTEGSR